MSEKREELVYTAKLAEQAERYEGDCGIICVYIIFLEFVNYIFKVIIHYSISSLC